MNKKYQRYIEFIVNDVEPPYFENMVEMYGLKDSEYPLVLSKIFNQPVTIKGNQLVYDPNDNIIYFEDRDAGYWRKLEYDNNGKVIYYEDSNAFWYKKEYDDQGNRIYYEDSYGVIRDNR